MVSCCETEEHSCAKTGNITLSLRFGTGSAYFLVLKEFLWPSAVVN